VEELKYNVNEYLKKSILLFVISVCMVYMVIFHIGYNASYILLSKPISLAKKTKYVFDFEIYETNVYEIILECKRRLSLEELEEFEKELKWGERYGYRGTLEDVIQYTIFLDSQVIINDRGSLEKNKGWSYNGQDISKHIMLTKNSNYSLEIEIMRPILFFEKTNPSIELRLESSALKEDAITKGLIFWFGLIPLLIMSVKYLIKGIRLRSVKKGDVANKK